MSFPLFDVMIAEHHPCDKRHVTTQYMPNYSRLATTDWQLSGVFARLVIEANLKALERSE